MLNFDKDRFVRIQRGAVDLAAPINDVIIALLRDGAENLFFLGSGGAGILMEPAWQLLQSRSTFPAYLSRPAELVVTDTAKLGEKSIVVIPSLSGTTQESIEMLSFAKGKGATVITLTGDANSPLAVSADHTFTNPAADDTSSESFFLQSLLIALSVMHERGEWGGYDETVRELQLLPELLLDVKEAYEPQAAETAQRLQNENYHIITGSGMSWPEAWYYGMCILEEMQWVRTRPVHASDFFHGTLELVEKGVSVLIVRGEDETRPLADRVIAFAPRVTDKVTVFDTSEFALPSISAVTRALISQVLLATIFERLSAHLEVVRTHPLTVRRYYKRIAY
ncbi:MAG: SIS domain-containing protein [Actinobacteria bacterium]|nr:SIS domain-containing protein [Actinomycetota bacterium]